MRANKPHPNPRAGYHLESWAGDAQYRLSHSFNYTEADIQQTYYPPFVAALRANVTSGASMLRCAASGHTRHNTHSRTHSHTPKLTPS